MSPPPPPPSDSADSDPAAAAFPDREVHKSSVTRRNWTSLWSVLIVQAQNAFNDNFVKITLIGLALIVAQGTAIGDRIEHIMSALIPIPFILLAPIAGYFSDRFSKRQVILLCVVAQIAIFIFIAASVWFRSIPMAVFGFFLLAVQSTMFSPAKQGILKELVGSERLGFANGFLQMLTMVGILAGMWLGGEWFDHLFEGYNEETGTSPDNAWRAAMIPILAIGGGALVPLAMSFAVEPTPNHPNTKFRKEIWWSHFVELGYLFSHRPIRIVALLTALYWLVANFLALTVFAFARELFPDVAEGGTTSASSKMLAFVGVGLMAGSMMVSLLSRKKIQLALAPVGAFGMAIGLAGLAFLEAGSTVWEYAFLFTGFASGFFLIPLAATLQDLPEEQHRGRVLAATNLLTSLSGVIAISISLVFRQIGLSASTQVFVFAVPLALIGLYTLNLANRLTTKPE